MPVAACGAIVSGRVVNGSEPDAVVPGIEVWLTGTVGAGDRLERTTRSGDDGWFRFTDVPDDTANVYVVSATFDGLEYASRLLSFAEGESEIGTDLFVYEATQSADDIRALGHHYIFDPAVDADSVMVTEFIVIANHGSRAFVAAAPLTFPLPAAARDVRVFDGFESAELVGHALEFRPTLHPGHLEGVIRYLIPAKEPLHFESTITIPTDEVTLLVTPVGSRVTGAGLQPMGITELAAGLRYDRYRITETVPGSSFSVAVEMVRSSGPNAWIIVGGLALVFAGLVSVRRRSERPTRGGGSPEARRLESERNRHLEELLDLERQSKVGDTPESEFQAQHDRLLAKATAVQEMIDRLSEADR